jgi:hypothetical protein
MLKKTSIILVIIFFSQWGCSTANKVITICPEEEKSQPEFLDWYRPKSGSTISIDEYKNYYQNTGYYNHNIESCAIPGKLREIVDRTRLFIDGNEITYVTVRDLLQMYYGLDRYGNACDIADGPLTIYWDSALSIGPHQLELEIKNNTGEVFKFSWCFTITE